MNDIDRGSLVRVKRRPASNEAKVVWARFDNREFEVLRVGNGKATIATPGETSTLSLDDLEEVTPTRELLRLT